jgi:hypothetical protein
MQPAPLAGAVLGQTSISEPSSALAASDDAPPSLVALEIALSFDPTAPSKAIDDASTELSKESR